MTTTTTHNIKDYSEDPIEEAKRIARETIEQAHDIAIELDEPTEGMYEFDAITIDGEQCDVAEIAIMHDYDRDWYALVERPRPNAALVQEAEKEMRIGDLLQQIELKVMMLSMACETEDEFAAAWAAVSATASQSMRIRLREIGADVDDPAPGYPGERIRAAPLRRSCHASTATTPCGHLS